MGALKALFTNSIWSNNQSLKYQRFTSSDGKDIGFRQFEFVAKS